MAPSKKDSDSAAGEAIRGLCILMQSAPDFNPDYNVVAQALGIAQSKNVYVVLSCNGTPYNTDDA
jgi:hypothetical protein